MNLKARLDKLEKADPPAKSWLETVNWGSGEPVPVPLYDPVAMVRDELLAEADRRAAGGVPEPLTEFGEAELKRYVDERERERRRA